MPLSPWVVLCAGFAACATPIEIRDRGVTQLDGCIVYSIREGPASGQLSGVELALAWGGGEETQGLTTAMWSCWTGRYFPGPGGWTSTTSSERRAWA